MRPVSKPFLVFAAISLTALISCRKEINAEINSTTSSAAQGGDPGLVPIPNYPFKYEGLVNLSVPRGDLSSTYSGNKIFFGGGRKYLGDGTSIYYKTVDIFNADNLSRTTTQLSQGRYWLSAGAVGGKVLFAGGMSAAGHSNRVDIYDIQTNTWTTAQLSQARYLIGVASTKTQVIFAGGITFNSQKSNVVDIYDVTTNSWSTSIIKDIEGVIVGTSANNIAVFGGADYTSNFIAPKAVIFNPQPLLQTVSPLTGHGDYYISATAIGGKVMFAGGYTTPLSKKVSIYDVPTKTWSSHDLSQGRLGIGACRVDKFAVFAGGSLADNGTSDRLDAYDNNNGQWYSMKLQNKWWPISAVGAGKKVLIASNASYIPTGQVMVYSVSNPPPTVSPLIP